MGKRFGVVLSLVLAMAVVGCKKKEEAATGGGANKPADKPADKPAGGLDEGDKFIFDSAKEDLQEAKDKAAKGEDAGTSCVAAMSYAEKLRDKKVPEIETFLSDLDKTCGYDIPIKVLETETAKAEEARKKAKPGDVLSECYNATASTALEDLKKKHAEDAKVKELEGRWNTACPKKE
jgi:hypothetical protein